MRSRSSDIARHVLAPSILCALVACQDEAPTPPPDPPRTVSPPPRTAHPPPPPSASAPTVEPATVSGPRVAAVALDPEDAVVIDAVADERVWREAPVVRWQTDYTGKPGAIVTEAQFAWSSEALYVLWRLEGAGLNTDRSRPVGVEREQLYLEDCVELFVAPDPKQPRRYFEIEVGPFGHFLDLLVDLRTKTFDTAWSAKLDIATAQDQAGRTATIEVAAGAPALRAVLSPGAELPMGLFRIEGKAPRHYLAWRPARTAKPNFHVPEAFGTLVLTPR